MAWKIEQFEEMKHPRGEQGKFTFKTKHTKKGGKRGRPRKKFAAMTSPAKRRFNMQNPLKT
jgi:hypothetical protein